MGYLLCRWFPVLHWRNANYPSVVLVTQPDLLNPTAPESPETGQNDEKSSRAGPPTFWEAMGLWMVGEWSDPRCR
jgi:hypothetical protein